MQEWHFKINGQVLIPGSEEKLYLKPENFTNLIRISDYQLKNMPTMMARLSIDKNLYDIIIKNAKNVAIKLTIEKFDKATESNDKTTEPYIDDEFNVFINNDINYNKELDYIESKLTNTKPREDVYKEVYIGLMSKQCIDANKNVANSILYNVDIQSTTVSCISGSHLLLEPFKYNPIKPQLIIPPQDTTAKYIEFMNSVSVFYETKYLFFIDEPMCTYLISRSGKGIKKKDELYNDVMIHIHPTTESEAVKQGMYVDETKQQYYVDINALDSKYTVDHDTAKIVDKLEAIINPNPENTVETKGDILDVKGYINRITNTVSEAVENFILDNITMVEDIYVMQQKMSNSVLDVLGPLTSEVGKISQELNKSLGDIPETVTVDIDGESVDIPIMELSFTQSAISSINSNLNLFNSNYKKLQKLETKFKEIKKESENTIYSCHEIEKYTGATTYVNDQDIVDPLSKSIDKAGVNSDTLSSNNNKNIQSNKNVSTTYASNLGSMCSTGSDLVNKIESIKAAATNYVLPSDLLNTFSNVGTSTNALIDAWSKTKEQSSIIEDNIKNFDGKVNSIKGITKLYKTLKPQIKEIKKIDIKKKFVSFTNDTRNLSNSLGDSKNLFKNFESIIGDAGSILGYGMLGDIANNLNSVADLTGIGKLGISKFSSNLNIGGLIGNRKVGTKVVVTKNDNPNEIKNIKSELETMINQLSVNKYDLDPSVFTPNKKYTVKNYNAHDDKDGTFILNKKTEIFIREDDTFVCNTMLDFAKIGEEADNKNATDTSKTNVNDTNTTDWKKQSEGEVVDSNKTVSTNGDTGILVGKGTTYDNSVTVGSNTYKLGTGSIYDTVSKINK